MTETSPQSSNATANQNPTSNSNLILGSDFGKHDNSIVPHKISDHDMAVQVSVWADGKWININDTLDQMNLGMDLNKVAKVVEAQVAKIADVESSANSAVKQAESAVSASKVNSEAIAAQSEAVSEAKSAISSANAAIQQTAANAASDAAKIRADVAQVQSEIDANKAANSASVEALKSDVSAAKQDLADVHDSLTKAQAAAEESQKAIDKSIAQINSDIEQGRKDIASAQQANADTAKQLDTYSKQAQDQGKTIKSIQDKQDGFTATLADVQGNVTQVSDKVDGLSASLKDAQDNVASVKAQSDQLSATLTDHAKSIATLTASAKELSSTLEDADGRLSKVEQTAQTNSSTLSDVQGDLSQVKQDATTLTATLKDAQGNISTLQQKADSVSSQLASAQGDIASLQTDVTGIKATLVSHEGDIHTLQADSKSLHDSMQDAQGDISTLKKTSTDVTSELKDHAGRISKTEQTASALVNEFADQQGHLNRVEQTAQGTQQTVTNQQGQINNIKTDAAGIHQTLTGQGNQIANINVTLNGLSSKYEGVSGDLGKLKSQAQWVTVTSAVDLNNAKTPCHEFLKGTVTNAPNEVAWWYLTVEGSESGRITQTVIADQSNNRYTRRWAYGWSAWVKDATQTDVTALSNRITTNSTQITQNQQTIALKADQSTVNNLTGEVSQNKAQLKIQADQISSKVSSTDFKTLDDKVNGMKIGGRNLVVGTGQDTIIDDTANAGTQGWRFAMIPLTQQPKIGDQVTVSAEGTLSGKGNLGTYDVILYNSTTSNARSNSERLSSGKRASATLQVNNLDGNGDTFLLIYAGNISDTEGKKNTVHHLKVEFGNMATDWTPAPEDLTTAIQKNGTAIDQTNQKISLKADQTEVDKIKNTATQNSSRLDILAGEVKSKVDETRVNNIVDGKGYATTSTVQSLVDQKAGTINESITNLTTELKNNSGGGINLLLNTETLQFSANVTSQTNNPNSANSLWHLSVGSLADWLKENPNITKLGISYDYELTGTTKASGIIRFGVNQAPVWEYMSGYNLDGKPLKGRAKIIIDVTDAMRNTRTDITRIRGDGLPIGATLKITHPKWEIGAVTPYSQAPSDNASVNQLQSVTASIDGLQSTVASKADRSQITQLSNLVQSKVSTSDFNNLRKAVDLQTLESADANNLKTNGHYFVHNLANNPVGGWVYVDVTGNGNDRIRQDVYQDNGNKHKYRRWFGNSWTNWSEGATESEITQLRDDINLRVKSGDLLSQINVEAGRTLIQSNKIYFDADSFVMSPNSKAFIPSAFITNLSADKITTGTLDASKLHVKNFSANDIEAGTLSGVTIKAGDTDFFQTSQDNIYWITNNGRQSALIGRGEYVTFPGLNIFDSHAIYLGTWAGADLENGTIKDTGGSLGHPKFNIELPADSAFDLFSKNGEMGSTMVPLDNSRISGWVDQHEFFYLKQTQGFHTELNPDLNTSQFRIQKNDHIGAYFGEGNNGNQITFNFGGNDGGLNVNGQLHVTGSKNSIVETRQGYLAINAYETAEYYFGDIGENNTGDTSQVVIGIDRIFNEVVNTDIQYQVFVTPYSNAHVWVEKRYNNRFIVKSDRPNAEFGWELKAKRKGYESNRLRRVNVDFNQMDLKGEN